MAKKWKESAGEPLGTTCLQSNLLRLPGPSPLSVLSLTEMSSFTLLKSCIYRQKHSLCGLVGDLRRTSLSHKARAPQIYRSGWILPKRPTARYLCFHPPALLTPPVWNVAAVGGETGARITSSVVGRRLHVRSGRRVVHISPPTSPKTRVLSAPRPPLAPPLTQ